MKNLLIIFIVLLFLLTLLSSFGGSIRHKEPFYDDSPAFVPPEMPEELPPLPLIPMDEEEKPIESMKIVEKFEVPEPFTHTENGSPWS